jgi:hypothetical protein
VVASAEMKLTRLSILTIGLDADWWAQVGIARLAKKCSSYLQKVAWRIPLRTADC